ncbi:MAG: DUF2461 domain-containing protein [Prevotella sp.]|nr:DUF2461 domain-containing protein [Prevotella sp.]
MQAQRIIQFLKDVTANNNRPWFQAHRDEYEAVKADFEQGAVRAIARLSAMDPSLSHLGVKDVTYRFYRDTRFSPDKSPYKNHIGMYIAAHGKKAMHGGYYLHLEPGHCLLSAGNYWLPNNVLNACRTEMAGQAELWLSTVEAPDFVRLFGRPGEGNWDSPRGFGLNMLKKTPQGYDAPDALAPYLRMKDFCAWHHVADSFFEGDKWLERMMPIFETARPMVDFVNAVIDDYE